MIYPGIAFDDIHIGDTIDKFPNAKFDHELSMGQKVYKIKDEVTIRVNNQGLINWIYTNSVSPKAIYNNLRVGSKFEEIIKTTPILYDEFEYQFKLEGVDGLVFSFDNFPLESLIEDGGKVSYIIIHDLEMNKSDHLIFDIKLSEENLDQFI